MNVNWKSIAHGALTAVVGGGLSAGSAAMLDPVKFGIHFGNGKLLEIMGEGAIVALAALVVGKKTGTNTNTTSIAETNTSVVKGNKDA